MPILNLKVPDWRKALWFTLTPVVLALVLLAIVAWKQRLHIPTETLYAFADSSAGIVEGMPVKLQGFAVGSVRQLELMQPQAGQGPKVRITARVNREYMALISRDAVFRIGREGVIGQAALEIVQGQMRARQAADGDVLAFERPRSIGEVAEDIRAQALPLLTDMRSLVGKLNDPQGDLLGVLGDTRKTMQQAGQTAVAFDKLARQGEATVAGVGARADKTFNNADRALSSVARVTEHAEKTLPLILDNSLQITRQLKSVLDHAEMVASQAEQLTGNAQKVVGQVQAVTGDAQEISGDARQIVGGAKRSWPFSAWAGRESTPAVSVDSQDHGRSFIQPRAEGKQP